MGLCKGSAFFRIVIPAAVSFQDSKTRQDSTARRRNT
jgi:hypothetical protein